jgi:hypothetical protein
MGRDIKGKTQDEWWWVRDGDKGGRNGKVICK